MFSMARTCNVTYDDPCWNLEVDHILLFFFSERRIFGPDLNEREGGSGLDFIKHVPVRHSLSSLTQHRFRKRVRLKLLTAKVPDIKLYRVQREERHRRIAPLLCPVIRAVIVHNTLPTARGVTYGVGLVDSSNDTMQPGALLLIMSTSI